MDLKNATYNCPFCYKSLPAESILKPSLFVCPVCDAEDKEWNAMFNCINCGYGHRVIECPHCREDFDTNGVMFTTPPGYLNYMRVSKYKGPKRSYRIGDLVIRDRMDFSPEQLSQKVAVYENLTFDFPEGAQKLKTFELYNIKKDEADDDLLWFSAYLYDKYDIAPNQDVGQIVITFRDGERKVHSVVDVSRNYIRR
jgi:hypothetical protein